jgi:hypothetical protein
LKEKLSLIMVLVAASLLMPLVMAQQTYTIPLLTVDWGSTRTIAVGIPSQPQWAYDTMLEGMQIWNQAQQWFVRSYYPQDTGSVFTLEPAKNSNPMVTVTYTQSKTIQCGSITVGGGCTTNDGTEIVIVLSGLEYCQCELAAHELGHVLGLGDNPSLSQDLMNRYVPFVNPSTLDLYAVFLVAQQFGAAQSGDSVTLPSTIPYYQWEPGMIPIPEFPITGLPVLVVCLSLVSILVRKKVKSSITI